MSLSARAGIPMPRLYVIRAEQPNAFMTRRNPVHSAVAVTNGLLEQLPREQMRGVLAGELAHIRNRDVLVSTIAAVITRAVSAIANFLQFLSHLRRRRRDEVLLSSPALDHHRAAGDHASPSSVSRASGSTSPTGPAPSFLETDARLPTRSSRSTRRSRSRRWRSTRRPRRSPCRPAERAGVTALFSTHPPVEERVRRLRAFEGAYTGRAAFAA